MTRDINRALEHVERVMARALDESIAKPPRKETLKTKSPKIRAWRAPASDHSRYPEPKARSVFREKINVTKLSLTARTMKVTIPLDATAIAMWPTPSQERIELVVRCDGLGYAASISTKSLRRAKSTISANGAEKVFVMLQGKLKGSEIIECGLVAQIKITKAPQGNIPQRASARHHDEGTDDAARSGRIAVCGQRRPALVESALRTTMLEGLLYAK
jgi:hypothetical protein